LALKNLLAYVILTYGMNWSASGVKKVSSHGWKASHHIWHREVAIHPVYKKITIPCMHRHTSYDLFYSFLFIFEQ
jgi:hypothetical protein